MAGERDSKPCRDTNLSREGKMPSRQPAGRRRYSRFSSVCQGVP